MADVELPEQPMAAAVLTEVVIGPVIVKYFAFTESHLTPLLKLKDTCEALQAGVGVINTLGGMGGMITEAHRAVQPQ